MYKTKEKTLIYLHRLLDLSIVALSFLIALKLRRSVSFAPLEPFEGGVRDYLWLLAIVLFLWHHLLYFYKVYISYRGKPVKNVIIAVIKANITGLVMIGFLLFFLNEYLIHRTLILLFFLICTAALTAEKFLLFSLLRRLRRSDMNIKFALIIGTGKRAIQLLELFNTAREVGFRVVGLLGDNPERVGERIKGVEILGVSSDLLEILQRRVIDEVFIAISPRNMETIKRMILDCERFGINARITALLFNPAAASIYMDEILDVPFITFTTTPLKIYQLYIKNVIDVATALALLIGLSPVFIALALLIKLDSRGAVFFKQKRTGVNGRTFTLYKFRSMYENSESRRPELENLNEMSGPVFKIRQDPRVTRVGRFIRRTSLDELPQLFNVLKRDMSLIGPRPLPVYEADRITGTARRRLSMKPGMTGSWQVNGRSDVEFDKWMKLDLAYIDGWSLWLDGRILAKTVLALVTGKGAR
ncbi:MAG: sugar transferase [Desulfobacterales bacterium]|nr:sugar transferase [Desulfobacterales bacterium]